MTGFLNKLWDETVAGPAPEFGLGMLRKNDSFSAVGSPPPPFNDHVKVVAPPVTRSITILKGNRGGDHRKLKVDSGEVPDSPAGSSNPGTPLTPGTPCGSLGTIADGRGSSADVADSTTSLTTNDWIVMTALDR